MGMYDIVHIKKDDEEGFSIQFKSGEQGLYYYEIGDEIPIKDGVHFCPEGAFVVFYGKVVAVFDSKEEFLTDKWGNEMEYPNLCSYMDIALRQIKQKDP